MKLHGKKINLLVPVLPLALVLGLVSCGGDDSKTVADSKPCAAADAIVAEATYSSLWTNVFENRCGTCHGSGTETNTLNGPDMRTKDSFYSGLFNKKAADYPNWTILQINSECLPFAFIDAGDSSQSLVAGVLDPARSPCTVKAHKEAPQNICISDGSLANLKKWIDSGAAK